MKKKKMWKKKMNHIVSKMDVVFTVPTKIQSFLPAINISQKKKRRVENSLSLLCNFQANKA